MNHLKDWSIQFCFFCSLIFCWQVTYMSTCFFFSFVLFEKLKKKLSDLTWRISILCLSVFIDNKRRRSAARETRGTVMFARRFPLFALTLSVCRAEGKWVYCKDTRRASGKLGTFWSSSWQTPPPGTPAEWNIQTRSRAWCLSKYNINKYSSTWWIFKYNKYSKI